MDGGDRPECDLRELLRRDARGECKSIGKRVLVYALRRTGSAARAKDLLQEAITRVLEGAGWVQWTFDGVGLPEDSLFKHLCSVVRHLAAKENERASEWREVRVVPRDGEEAPDAASDPDEPAAVERAHAERVSLADRVLSRLDDRARAMLELEEQGVHDAAEQARRLGCTVKDVYSARKRVAHHRDAVLAEAREGDDS